jgi:hypothetical protein
MAKTTTGKRETRPSTQGGLFPCGATAKTKGHGPLELPRSAAHNTTPMSFYQTRLIALPQKSSPCAPMIRQPRHVRAESALSSVSNEAAPQQNNKNRAWFSCGATAKTTNGLSTNYSRPAGARGPASYYGAAVKTLTEKKETRPTAFPVEPRQRQKQQMTSQWPNEEMLGPSGLVTRSDPSRVYPPVFGVYWVSRVSSLQSPWCFS